MYFLYNKGTTTGKINRLSNRSTLGKTMTRPPMATMNNHSQKTTCLSNKLSEDASNKSSRNSLNSTMK